MDDKELTGQESLQLIERMIGKAKADFHESGTSALLWGSVIIVCSLTALLNLQLHLAALDYVWLLTFVAIVPQVMISIRESRRRRFKTYTDDAMSGIWISFGIAIFLASFYSGMFRLPHPAVLYLMLYGMPTFATGITHRFKPMIAGGLVCWACAVVALFVQSPAIDYVLFCVSAFFAWLLPGLLLRARYLKAKRHV